MGLSRKEHWSGVIIDPNSYSSVCRDIFIILHFPPLQITSLVLFVQSFFPSFNNCMCQGFGHGGKADPRARFLLAGDSAAVRETDKATEDVQRQGVTRAGRS